MKHAAAAPATHAHTHTHTHMDLDTGIGLRCVLFKTQIPFRILSSGILPWRSVQSVPPTICDDPHQYRETVQNLLGWSQKRNTKSLLWATRRFVTFHTFTLIFLDIVLRYTLDLRTSLDYLKRMSQKSTTLGSKSLIKPLDWDRTEHVFCLEDGFVFLPLCFPFDVFSVFLFVLDSCFYSISPSFSNSLFDFFVGSLPLWIYTVHILWIYTHNCILYTVFKNFIILCLDFASISDI